MFIGPFDHSILKRANEKQLVDIAMINIRDFGLGKHRIVDDTPYGGGIGMVMRVDVLHKAIQHVTCQKPKVRCKERIVLLSASGTQFSQQKAQEFSQLDHLVLICGHYEGVDERVSRYIDEEISIGDFVLTGGEIPAMLVTDSVVRLIQGVLPEGAAEDESFSQIDSNNNLLLEYPHYTKPNTYQEQQVPEILLTGDHKKIAEWRNEKRIEKTTLLRPDLLKNK